MAKLFHPPQGPRAPWISWLVLALIGMPLGLSLQSALADLAGDEVIRWRHPWAFALLASVLLLGWVGFHLREARAPTMLFTRVAEIAVVRRGLVARLATLPEMMRILAVALLACALARPETVRSEEIEVEGIDIMIALDLSRSMEERDLGERRIDAGKRTIQRFLASLGSDRVGLVVFAKQAMLQCPLTIDMSGLAGLVADVEIGQVPERGTAVGDALALTLLHLGRSDARSKVVILLSDGDSNTADKFSPAEAADLAASMGVKVFTILLGGDDAAPPASPSAIAPPLERHLANPALLQEIAKKTGGRYFRAADASALQASFAAVRETLDKTRRRVVGRVAGAELYPWLLVPAMVLLAIEMLMRLGRWRRFP